MSAGPSLKRKVSQDDLLDVERVLQMEDTLVNREAEVIRVINSFKYNPYDVLGFTPVPPDFPTLEEIKKRYRQRSLLIHPDKIKHPRGVEAFDLLKKAQTELEDEKKKKEIEQTMYVLHVRRPDAHSCDGRMLVCRELGAPDQAPDDHPKLRKLTPDDLRARILAKTKEILIDDELRRRRVRSMHMIAEGAENKKKDDEISEKRRKQEEKKKWEETCEDRVSDWRSFTKGGSKSKKQKVGYLG